MGSVVALKSTEKHVGLYDGTISMCSLGAGTTGNWDLKLDLALAYDVAFGWPDAWGTVGNVRDDINFDAEVFPKFIGEFTNPANRGRFEFIRLVNGLPEGGFYAPAGSLGPGAIVNAYLFTAGRAELEARAGGAVAQNLDHVYRLDDDERVYLQSLGVDVDDLLAAMNARTDIEARRSARSYLERYADYRGHIHGPVLLIHNIEDPLAPVELTSAYLETVAATGKADHLVRVFTDRVGHCNFTPEQVRATILAMDAWLDSGTPPGDAFFPTDLEFVHGYEPGPWPQPPQ
jgi:pimeloyl-ACP methyl ester carboxylesterase